MPIAVGESLALLIVVGGLPAYSSSNTISLHIHTDIEENTEQNTELITIIYNDNILIIASLCNNNHCLRVRDGNPAEKHFSDSSGMTGVIGIIIHNYLPNWVELHLDLSLQLWGHQANFYPIHTNL